MLDYKTFVRILMLKKTKNLMSFFKLFIRELKTFFLV